MRIATNQSIRLCGITALVLLFFSACGGSVGGNNDSGSTTHVLTVSNSSQGSVTSDPVGINCGSTCTTTFADGQSVTLTATPQSGYSFSGWGAACTGTGTCTLTMDADKSVVATFASQSGSYILSVSKVGSGTVSSTSGAINCGSTCSAAIAAGTSVTLNAAAASGYVFSGWSGSGCSGTGTCVVSMAAARTVTATFISSSGGITYYVAPAPTGSDSNNGRSLGAPFKTISHAVNAVSAGDVIEIRAGTYNENVTITTPGTSTGWIVMRAYNGEQAVIRSAGAGPTVWFYHDDCDESVIGNGSGNTDCRPLYWMLQGLEIQGSPNGGDDGNAVKIDTPKVKLVGNKLCCAVADVVKMVRTSNDVEVLDNEIWQNSAIVTPGTNAQGIDIVGADRVRVAGNYIHDVPDIGVYAKGNSRDVVFENNLLANIGASNNGHALMLGQSTDSYRLVDGTYETYDSIIRNNVVVNATWSCIATSSSQNVHIYNNSCYNTGTSTHGSILLSNESEVSQPGTNIEIRNNIIFGSANNPVIKIASNAMADYSTLHVDHNIYYVTGANPTFTWDDYGQTAINFPAWQTQTFNHAAANDSSSVANPQYSDTSASNSSPLTLQATSPAIDAGVTTAYVTSDRQGTARPQGSGFDIGAYEFAATSSGAMELPVSGQAATLVRYPFLQVANSPTSLRIVWATSSSGTSQVRYRLAAGGSSTTVNASQVQYPGATTGITTFFQQEALVTGLQAGGSYLYDIIHNGTVVARNIPFVALRDSTASGVSFIALGDSGTSYSTPRNVRDKIASRAANGDYVYAHDFVVGVGDIAYNAGSYAEYDTNFFDQMSGRGDSGSGENGILATRPFVPMPGNHDYQQTYANTPAGYLGSFVLPTTGVPGADAERYYSFDSGDAHFVVLDSMKFDVNGTTTASNGLQAMLDWLDADLVNTTRTWRVVFFHHTIFSNGGHGTWGDLPANQGMRQQLAPILQNRGVQLVMFGHDHLYQRSKRLSVDTNGKIVRSACSGNGVTSNVVESNSGIVYIVTGNGGDDLHHRSADPTKVCGTADYNTYVTQYGDGYDFVAMNGSVPVLYDLPTVGETPTTPAERHGFTHVSISGSQMTITAYTYEGVVLDQYTMPAH